MEVREKFMRFILGERAAKNHMIDVLSGVPALAQRRVDNVFSVQAEIQIIVIGSESIDGYYLMPRERRVEEPRSH